MTSEIYKLKHFHVENYSGIYFTDELNAGEEFLYTTIAIYKYRTNTYKMTASDYTHLFGYLNPYYRSAYNIPKRRK